MNQQQTSTPSQKDKAVSFLMLVTTGKVREAFHSYIGPDFRHHNPFFNGDADLLMIAMEKNAIQSPNKKVESKLVIEEDDKSSGIFPYKATSREFRRSSGAYLSLPKRPNF